MGRMMLSTFLEEPRKFWREVGFFKGKINIRSKLIQHAPKPTTIPNSQHCQAKLWGKREVRDIPNFSILFLTL
jgi:hypothetical protein